MSDDRVALAWNS